MELEATRLITTWLRHGTYGVNALLPGQDLSPPDAVDTPEHPRLDLSQYLVDDILNDYEDDVLVEGSEEPQNPRTLVVMANGANLVPWRSDPVLQLEAKPLEIGIAYLLRDRLGSIDRRVMHYTMRAVRQSLMALAQIPAGPARTTARTENGVELLKLERLQYERLAGRIGRAAMLGVVRCSWHVRDTRP